jgi:allantoinase
MSQAVYDLAVSGNIVLGDSVLENATLLVKDGRIAAISDQVEGLSAEKHINADQKYIFPGAIDVHVHSLSYPGEGFVNSTRSAGAGGVTTIVDMPVDAPLGIATPEALQAKIDLVERDSVVDVALLGSVKNGTSQHIPALKDAGVCGYKLSLFDTDPNRFPRVNDGELLEAFELIRKTGYTAGVHAENDEIIKRLIDQYQAAGKTYPRAHCETRPECSETESALKGFEIARAAGVRFHVYHVSCARTVELMRQYRAEGFDFTAETCPHYLIFSEEDIDRLGGKLRCNPPVRKLEDVEKLWKMLEAGEINLVSSDHAPWPEEKKVAENIFENLCGAPGVEMLLPLMYSEGVAKGRITLATLNRILMEAPARFSSLYPQKGTLTPGSDADMVIFDPNQKWTVRGSDQHSIAGWTPYEGMELTGKVETTIVRGQIVYDRGEFKVDSGFGNFVRPEA